VTDQRIIDSTAGSASLTADWIVALAFAGLAFFLTGVVFVGDRFSGNTAAKWIAGAFLLLGLRMLFRVAFQTRDAFSYGHIRLHLRATPVTIGGALEGEIEFPRKASSVSHVVGTLACTRFKWHGGPHSGVRSEQDVWATSKGLELIVTGPRGRASLRFDIPAGQPHSGEHLLNGRTAGTADAVDHAWELRLWAAAPRRNLDRRFPIIVLADTHH
jgi:hypothetical protein